MADIKQPSFPTDFEDIAKFLETKYQIKRARESLVRNLILFFTKIVLNILPDLSDKRQEILLALKAISQIQPTVYANVLSRDLSKLVDRLPDEDLWLLIDFIASESKLWEWLNEGMQIRFKNISRESRFLPKC